MLQSNVGREPRAHNSRVVVGFAAALLLVSALSTIGLAPLFDPDEGYYPATAAEGLASGRAWDPKFNDAPRWDKPILTYALIQGSFQIFGTTVPASRLPSVLEGVLLILMVGFVVNRVAGARAAGLAALVLATTTGIQIFARVAHPEIGLVLMITAAELLAVLALTTGDTASRLRLAASVGLALGLGTLFKGPVAIALPALAVGCACVPMFGLHLPSKAFVRGMLIALGIGVCVAFPWYAAMTWRHGSAFLHEALWRQNVGRFMGDSLMHHGRPWSFVLPALLAMFPWSAFIPAAFTGISRSSREPRNVLRLVMASAAVTSFVFYSASGSRLPHYALAFVPPLAILIALRLSEIEAPSELSFSLRATTAIVALAAVALAIAPSLVDRVIRARDILGGLSREADLTSMFALALWPPAAFLTAIAVAMLAVKKRTLAIVAVAGAVLPTLMIVAAGPLLVRAYPEDRFAARLRQSDLPVWMIGPRAPSLTFYTGRRVERFSEGEQRDKALPRREGWIVADTGWLMRRTQSPEDASRLQIIDSYGSLTLARWHGAGDSRPPADD